MSVTHRDVMEAVDAHAKVVKEFATLQSKASPIASRQNVEDMLTDFANDLTFEDPETDVKKMPNAVFFKHIAEFSKAGPLAQLVMVSAIGAYLENVLSEPCPEEVGNPIVSNKAWYEACKVLKAEFDAKYDTGSNQPVSTPTGEVRLEQSGG